MPKMRSLPLLVLLLACSNNAQTPPATEATIVVNVPLAKAGAISKQIVQGARLAVEQLNASASPKARLAVKVLDSELSPARTADNVREAVRLGAVAVVDEGTGVDAAWRIANEAGIPIGIVFQGGRDLVDPRTRPNVFRIAPTDRGSAFRLAEYLVPKNLRIAILHDDSTYGTGGAAALATAFSRNRSSVTTTIRLPATATDVSAQTLAAKRSGATALLVWTRPALLATVIRSARSSGWKVPVYAPTSGEDPVVREELADHPEWADGLTFTMSRLTSEKGTKPFETFRSAYEKRYGVQRIGVRSNGKVVVQAPDWAMYSYDFVRVVAAAMTRAGTTKPGAALIAAMNDVEVQGANGDERSFNERNHEGVVDDDIFFAVVRSLKWVPVRDDALSATLPPIKQTL